MATKTLRLVLGDQLNHQHPWWNDDPETFEVLMCECLEETGYVTHHIQKVVAFFLAMRNFAKWLREEKGIAVHYMYLDSPDNTQSICGNVEALLQKGSFHSWAYQLPDEYRLDRALSDFAEKAPHPCATADTAHFLSERYELRDFFKGKKTYLMERFYRMMRKKYDVLMAGESPVDGKWNFDQQNRKSLPENAQVPEVKSYNHRVQDVVDLLAKMQVKTIGNIDAENFIWPVSRAESLDLLEHFAEACLQKFGDYQDAMKRGAWSLFHSRVSFALNSKMLTPLEVIKRVEMAWQADEKKAPIAAVEGFIRQILGWREYMRGVYWARMPEYATMNYFGHEGKLPAWFWTGDTKMQCMKQAVGQSLDHAYAHHIQRLMVTGNFALLAGVHPDEVDQWYLGVYIDAIEWVEITNTRGMSQYADGGIVGTKPYVSSANYIDKMSDYCGSCHYSKSKKTGENACPFNSLYWHFYERHRDKLEKNPRIGFVYQTLNKMKPDTKADLMAHADHILGQLDDL
jgi:deoxyribodipyrimidine photolyase-related protein